MILKTYCYRCPHCMLRFERRDVAPPSDPFCPRCLTKSKRDYPAEARTVTFANAATIREVRQTEAGPGYLREETRKQREPGGSRPRRWS